MKIRRHKKVVAERLVIARINRHLTRDNLRIYKKRGRSAGHWSQDYFLLDLANNHVSEESADLNKIIEDLGALKPWEIIE
jgi:hypothetical protein